MPLSSAQFGSYAAESDSIIGLGMVFLCFLFSFSFFFFFGGGGLTIYYSICIGELGTCKVDGVGRMRAFLTLQSG